MIEKSLLFLSFYIAVVAAVDFCFPGFDEYCYDRTLPILIGVGVLLLLIIGWWCCFDRRRQRQGMLKTITVNKEQYLVLQKTPTAPGADHSQSAVARLVSVTAPPYVPRAAEYQSLHAGETSVQKHPLPPVPCHVTQV